VGVAACRRGSEVGERVGQKVACRMELGAGERMKFVEPGMQELAGENMPVSEAACTWVFGWVQKGAAVILQVQL
jgi:hypothetical protein